MKWLKAVVIAGIFSTLMANISFAGSWETADNATWKYKNDDGTYASNTWIKDNNKWYFLKIDGTMAVGWNQVNGVWYYLYTDGSMAANTVVDGYTLDVNGAWTQKAESNAQSTEKYDLYQDKPSHKSWCYLEDKSVTRNGKTWSKVIRLNGGDSYAEYELKGDYSTLEFKVALSHGCDRDSIMDLNIYGDNDTLLYCVEGIDEDTEEYVTVNVTGQKTITFDPDTIEAGDTNSLVISTPTLY